MNNIGVFKDHDYMDDKDQTIKALTDLIMSLEDNLKDSDTVIRDLKEQLQEQASANVKHILHLQDELYNVNKLWFNRLYVFITTLRVRNPFYNGVQWEYNDD
jgi:hypothetical protein